MSETLDTRVVRMEFDNRQFEKNIKKTSQSLEDLKQNLDFKGVDSGIDKVRLKISALEIATTTFVVKLSNQLINLGVTLIKSLSVDNISSGWAKFGEKTTSVATMMAQKIRIAGKEITDLGLKTEIVNKQLELLTWFSDETSYSFTDMVNNVGKFTAAGQDLDVSVKAMEGIATWAALSGQNAQTASRAMYQLAQAMGKGRIQKIDWMSIQNANMDTEEFREIILETAVAMGQLTKEGDKFVTKTSKKFTKAQFSDYLSEGWFTSDVLVSGLNKYSAAIDQIYEISIKEGITASEVIEKYGDTLDEFGVKAFKAAQEARTFADVINSVKDAVSSKWMTTFESIFGGEEESVKLWTDLANELYDVFAESGNFRNEILSVWKELGGRDDLFARGEDNQGAFWNIYDAIIALRDLIKSAWDTVFPLSEMESYDDQVTDIGNKFKLLTSRIREFTQNLKMSEANASRLSKIFQGIFNVLKSGLIIVKSIRYIIDPILEVGKRLISEVLDQITYYGSKIGSLGSKFESIIIKIHDSIEDLLDVLNPVGILSSFFNFIQKIVKFISDYKPITRLIGHINNFINALKETTNIKNDLSNVLNMIWSAFSLIGKVITQVLTVIFKLLPVLSKVLNVISKIFGYVIGTISKIIGFISKLVEIIINFVKNSNILESIKNTVVQLFTSVYNFLSPLLKIIIEAGKIIGKFLKEVLLAIPKVLGIVTKAIENSNILQIISNILTGLINIIRDFISTAGKISGNVSSGFSKAITTLFSGLMTFIKSLVPVLQVLATVLGKLLEIVGTLINKVFTAILNVLTGKDVGKMLKALLTLALIYGIVKTALWLFWSIKSTLLPIHTLLESITDICDSIYSSLQTTSFERIVNSLLKIAVSVALLSSIKEDALTSALSSIIVLSGIVVGIMFVLNKMTDAVKIIHRRSRSLTKAFIGIVDQIRENIAALQNLQKISSITEAISRISNALIKAAIAILILSKIPEKDLWRSLAVALAILGFVTGTIYFLNKHTSIKSAKKISKTLKSLVGMITLLIGVGIAIRILSGQNWSNSLAASGSIILILESLLGVVLILRKMHSVESNVRSGIMSLLILSNGILAIAMSLRLVASANWKNILAATSSISIVVSALSGIVILLGKFANAKTVGLFALFASALIPFARSMILLSMAIAVLGSLEYGKVWNSVAAITVFSVVISAISNLIGIMNPAKFMIFSVSLVPFLFAITLLAGAIAVLGSLEYGKVWNSVAVIVAFTSVISLVSKLTNVLDSISFTIFSSSLIAFSVAIELIAGVLATLSALPSDRVWDGMKAIIAFVALAALSIKLIGILSALKFAVFSKSLMKFATAMVIMSTSIVSLGLLSQEQVDRGRKAIQSFIAVVALAIKLIGILSALKFSVFAGSMILFGNAMMIISGVIAILGSMDSSSMWRGIGAIMAFTSGLAAISILLSYNRAGISLIGLALGMTVFSSALLPFISALLMLGDIDLRQLGIGLLVLSASMGTLALVATVLKPTIAIILALSTAMLLAGVGMLSAGVGLTALATGLEAIAIAFVAQFESLKTILVGISSLIIEILLGAVLTLVERLNDIVPSIFTLINTVLDRLIALLYEKGPAIIEIVLTILDDLLKSILDHAESIFKSIFNIIEILINKLNEHILPIADKLFKILLKILDKLIEYTPAIVEKIIKALIALTKALFENIGTLLDIILDYTFDFIGKLIVGITRKTVALAGLLSKVILIVLSSALRLTIASLGSLSQLLLVFMSSLLLLAAKTFINLGNVLNKVLLEILESIIHTAIDVIVSSTKALNYIGRAIGAAILGGLIQLISESYLWLVDVFDFIFKTDYASKIRSGIGDISDSVIKSAHNSANEISAGMSSIISAIKSSGNDISDIVNMTSNEANSAVQSSLSAIGGAVESATSQMSDALQDFGEDAGNNLLDGLDKGANSSNSEAIGSNIADNVKNGFERKADINSPSKVFARLGQYLMQGLSLGIQNGSNETYNVMSETLNKSLILANNIIDDQSGNDITLKVGLDISSVESSAYKIQDIMSSVNNPSLSAAGINADYTSRTMSKDKRSANNGTPVTNNNSSDYTYNNVFNISSTDPRESAEEIDKILQQQVMRKKLAHGM